MWAANAIGVHFCRGHGHLGWSAPERERRDGRPVGGRLEGEPRPYGRAQRRPFPPAGPTRKPSAKPSATTAPTDREAIRVDGIATVVADSLRVRSAPNVGPESTKLSPLLSRRDLVYVVDGPVHASDYDWYQVQPVVTPNAAALDLFGWVAAGDHEGAAWLELTPDPCSDDVDGYEKVADMAPMIRLACLRDNEISFTARLAVPGRLGATSTRAGPSNRSGSGQAVRGPSSWSLTQ